MVETKEELLSDLLAEDEIDTVILAFLYGNGDSTKAEIKQALDWAADAKLQATLLSLVLEHRLSIMLRDGSLAFKTIGPVQ